MAVYCTEFRLRTHMVKQQRDLGPLTSYGNWVSLKKGCSTTVKSSLPSYAPVLIRSSSSTYAYTSLQMTWCKSLIITYVIEPRCFWHSAQQFCFQDAAASKPAKYTSTLALLSLIEVHGLAEKTYWWTIVHVIPWTKCSWATSIIFTTFTSILFTCACTKIIITSQDPPHSGALCS